MLPTREASKLIAKIQEYRSIQESVGDESAAQALTQAIAAVVQASDQVSQPPATDQELAELARIATSPADLYKRSIAHHNFVLKSARREIFGVQPLRRPEMAQAN